MAWKKSLLSIAALLVTVAGPAAAQTLRAGDDGLDTPGGGQTSFNLISVPIEEVFKASVVGDPVVSLQGRALDSRFPGVDTIIRRPADITFRRNQATGPIRVVALNLQSEKTVQIGTRHYGVTLRLSEASQEVGSASLTRTSQDGGTFSATLPVVPRLTFHDKETGEAIVIDCGLIPCDKYVLRIDNVGWTLTGGPGGFDPRIHNQTLLPANAVIDSDGDGREDLPLLGSSNFFPGVTATSSFPESGFGISVREPIIIIIHWVRPPRGPFPPEPPIWGPTF